MRLHIKNCNGCHSCYNICPKNCISMQSNDEGFLYPHIDEEKCSNCGLCEKVCPLLHDDVERHHLEAYAAMSYNSDIRKSSSSGGVFNLIANYVVDNNGVVFGAAFDEKFNVKHISVFEKKEIIKLQKSKYVQSQIGDTFKQAKTYLEQGILVLFTGTPCQIGGLLNYLGKSYDNLITQDIICHGVPSPLLWQKYLDYISDDTPICVDFRNKEYGWTKFKVLLRYLNDVNEAVYSKNQYMQMFLKNICLRASCYNCSFKTLERPSDITLADFWGVKNVMPEMFDDKGTSLVFVNSKKGQQIFDVIKKHLKYDKAPLEKALEYNASAIASVAPHCKRKKYLKHINDSDFEYLYNKCFLLNPIEKVIVKFKNLIIRLNHFVKRVLI